MKIKDTLLAAAQVKYQEIKKDQTRVRITDPIITPFVMAMKLGGYVEVLRNGCSTLRGCPLCPVGKSNYSALYTKDGGRFWACPHCQEITAE